MMLAISIVFFLVSNGAAYKLKGELSDSIFPYQVILYKEPRFLLSWNYNSTHIIFRTRAQTNGYVGFGISPDGKMANSDMAAGWVVNGQGYFADRFAYNYSEPVVDERQDWYLIEAKEDGGFTTLVFIRKLITCDDVQDMKIETGKTKVIYSISDHDLPSGPSQRASCVHNNMGMKQVELVPRGLKIENTCT
ncbi:hypothetical protein Btru_010846 [Bulinus truncatus]|nr:hypothetical protein Btru_010846 [Bulinus truncatus]